MDAPGKNWMNKQGNIARCYLCNCAFVDKKVYEHMFEKRFNASGVEQNTLATILAMVLGSKLEEEQLHSTVSPSQGFT